jgi:hypothetical protein
MRPSRGMGAIAPSKMPKRKTIIRKDDPNRVSMFAKGGSVAEGKKWISGAIKHPGALHKQLGVPAGEKIPAKKLAKAAKAPGKLGQRARLAETLKGMRKK